MYQLNKTLVFFLIFTIISSALAFKIVISAYSSYDTSYDDSYISEQPSKVVHADNITVFYPKSNSVVQSPLGVKGKAKGIWYFEASFPIRLFDASGKEITATPAQAQGDWMTANFVPFEATLVFDKPTTSIGTLVLHKDNPSGDPAKDDSVSIPVRFSQ